MTVDLTPFRTSAAVNVGALHPELAARVHATLLDPRLGGRVRIISAARTYATQRRLYDAWRAGRYKVPVVADPNRTVPDPYMPGGLVRGSRHMIQADGYAHAVDFDFAPHRDDWPLLERVARDHGLRRTVPAEGWHYELDRRWTPPPAPAPPPPPPPPAAATPEDDAVTLVEVEDAFPFTNADPLTLLVGPYGWFRVLQPHAKSYYRARFQARRVHVTAIVRPDGTYTGFLPPDANLGDL